MCGRSNVYTNPLTNPQRNPNVERKVKQNGKVKFEGKWYHVGRKMSGETVNVKITQRGVEVWHKGAFIKRWK